MYNTFSLLNFNDEIIAKDDSVVKLFKFLKKNISPVKKDIKWLMRQKKNGMTECRTIVGYYNTEDVLEYIDSLINTCHTRQKEHIPMWKLHKKLILSKV
jgi:glycerol-3-phosphate responsive antiterminator